MVINSVRTMHEVLDRGPVRGLGEAQDIDGQDGQTSPTDRCHCDNLPPEVLAQILELVVVSTWKDGSCSAPNTAQTSTFPIGGSGGAEIVSAEACGGQKIVYPKLFLVVCKRWCAISLGTPSLWSYLWIRDDSTLDNISMFLKRSSRLPLSIKFDYLSKKTRLDDLEVMCEDKKLSERRRLLYLNNGLKPPLGVFYEDRTALTRFNKALSLVAQHFERWSRFHLTAVQLRYIHHTASMVSNLGKNCRSQLLEYGLQLKLRDASDIDFDLALETKESCSDNPMPFLRKLTFSRDCVPAVLSFVSESHPSIQETFPVLRELEVHHLRGRMLSNFLKTLGGIPQLRILRLCHSRGNKEKPIQGISIPFVVLHALEELTITDSDRSTLTRLFNVISAPNVESLFIMRTGICDLFADVARRHSLFVSVQKLTLKGVWLRSKLRLQGIDSLFSAMPEVTTIHLDSAPGIVLKPLTGSRLAAMDQDTDTENQLLSNSLLLPKLTEISLSACDGNEIVSVVSGRRELGVPVKTLRINKSSILSGVVSYEHWETLHSQVEKLSWFEEDRDARSD
ncbi:hypothetical protein SCHPADRAFT_1001457 [Schizopora paradoxa]|uniref:F-box domain-containing protein n=1 Tax=Schizopora paradoxa TaxID=27342 RepID=A0A0H2R8L5_9AGAM|nr:hypothetical protein SCHPADRAFT_1001457 [Schizopora paradoxa]